MLQLSEAEWHTLAALGNGLIPAMNAEQDKFRELYEQVFDSVPTFTVLQMRAALFALSFRASAVALTRSHKLITEMSLDEKQALLLGFYSSRIPKLRMFVAGLISMSTMVWCQGDPEMLERIGFPVADAHFKQLRQRFDDWNPTIVAPQASLASDAPTVLSADVVIVGSGCSSMVTAYRLVKQGFSVIILEKGSYISSATSPESDYARNKLAFQSGGSLPSADSSLFMLAGATVGGGGAVNWSCSLRTPEPIRQEWVERGAPFYGERVYDEAMDEVERVMQVTHDTKPHSFTNSLILESAAKLHYPAATTGQNTGKHSPNTGYFEFGDRKGESEGGVAEWLRFAIANGAQLLDNTEVLRIRHRNGRASGVDAVYARGQKLSVNAKRVVCAAGSLLTPNLLKKSNFKNKRIGKGLKLHPVTLAYGEFDEVVNKRTDPIMTAVSTVSDNLDGQFHGPKLEAIHHQPHLVFAFLPYRSAEDYQRRIESYKHLSAILVITRDKSRGTVNYDPRKPDDPVIDYRTNDYDMWALQQGTLSAANMLYVGGAKRIFLSSKDIPDFVSTKPKEQRSIWDPEFTSWKAKVSRTKFVAFDTTVGSAHQMASCRISDRGPQYGPVDSKGRLYECSNVHVVDTSVFPTASGVNPMISCMATAYVLAGYLLDDLSKSATKL